jgi:hypothetical protein
MSREKKDVKSTVQYETQEQDASSRKKFNQLYADYLKKLLEKKSVDQPAMNEWLNKAQQHPAMYTFTSIEDADNFLEEAAENKVEFLCFHCTVDKATGEFKATGKVKLSLGDGNCYTGDFAPKTVEPKEFL